jgi:hypothetical protein
MEMIMKKILMMLLALILVLTLTGCRAEIEREEEDVDISDSAIYTEEVEEEEEEEEEIIEEEEIPEEEEREPVDTGDLSDDIYSFQVMINGHVFSLPFEWSYAESLGWELGDRFDDVELGPNQRTFSNRVWQGNTGLSMGIGNLSPNNIDVSEGIVGNIRVDDRDMETGVEFMLPGGLTIGSPEELIVELYGEPSRTSHSDTINRYNFELSTQVSVDIHVRNETGLVYEITLMNFEERVESTFDGELSELAMRYVPPTELGDDFTQGIVELEGVVYQLPAPVAVFLNNGWIIEDESVMIAAGRSAVGQRLRYGNQVMRLEIKNYDTVEVPVTEGFITSIEFSRHQWQGNIALPGGITPDSTEAEIMALLGEPARDSESSNFHGFTWQVTRENSMWESIAVTFLTEDGSVHSITVKNDLRNFPW